MRKNIILVCLILLLTRCDPFRIVSMSVNGTDSYQAGANGCQIDLNAKRIVGTGNIQIRIIGSGGIKYDFSQITMTPSSKKIDGIEVVDNVSKKSLGAVVAAAQSNDLTVTLHVVPMPAKDEQMMIYPGSFAMCQGERLVTDTLVLK